ncbi:MAG: alanine racemase [Verrucomicrobia bacterium]|nr:alanine racemase [Verrucomicrobiota bacterium]
MSTSHRCWAEINLEAIKKNFRFLQSKVASGAKFISVIKADAYGHGLAQVARGLNEITDLFGVANFQEACDARAAGVNAPILILSPALPQERSQIVEQGFVPSVSSAEEAIEYSKLTQAVVPLHLVFDTGMGRMGLWMLEAHEAVKMIRQVPNIRIEAVSTHLPVADEDPDFTKKQLEYFNTQLRHLSLSKIPRAALLSAGVLGFGSFAKPGDYIRLGLSLYGVSPLPNFQQFLKPALSFKTRISLVRQLGPGRSISYGRTFITDKATKVATLCAGYADGFVRSLSNRNADVLIQGQRCGLLGRVTMDQIMVDVSKLLDVTPGEEVIMIGSQDSEQISITEIAAKAETIPWEILTGISRRVARVYVS